MAYIGTNSLDTCRTTIDYDDGAHEHTCTRHDTAHTLSHRCTCGYRWYHDVFDGAGGYTSDL